MGFKEFFGGEDMSKLDYLEEERKKLWAKILEIEADLQKKTSDFEKEAKQSSRKASEYRNRCEDSKDAALKHLSSIEQAHNQTNNHLEALKEIELEVSAIKEKCQGKLKYTQDSYEEITSLEASIRKKIETLENIFENHPSLNEEIENLESIFAEGEELQNKINIIHKSSLTRKKEIDQLFHDIFGYTNKDEDGSETRVEGMKDELENSFEEIKTDITNFSDDISSFKESKEAEIVNFIENWTHKIEGINKKITDLLPNALTAGLSSAYSIKKEAEENEADKHNTNFHKSIFWLVIISLIPFAVNIVQLFQGKELEKLILEMPRLVLAILPLYIPLLWVAYTSNKKSNLSKRLIEEYTHKEVLSKTFEGLSRQINDIDDEDISSELRIKLIFNILNVSSENPGKLITDYNKADHPLIDALDKSVQLATAVDKLSNIPGFTKISKMLDVKSKQLLKEKAMKAEQGLASLNEENEDIEEEKTN